jgi:beta-lactam-binding protein with PASTA domain
LKGIVSFVFSRVFIVNMVLAVLILIMLLFGTIWYLKSYTKFGETVTVRDLTGLTVAEVEDVLGSSKLAFVVYDSVFVPGKKPLSVIDQEPKPLSKVKENRVIYITINASKPPKVGLPDVVDKPFREASKKILNAGLKLDSIIYKPSGIEGNFVMEVLFAGQLINAGYKLPIGSKVDLVVSSGFGEAMEVPCLIGLSYNTAQITLGELYLTIGATVYDATVTDSSTAVIVRQIPEYQTGVTLNVGTPIDLFFSAYLPDELGNNPCPETDTLDTNLNDGGNEF